MAGPKTEMLKIKTGTFKVVYSKTADASYETKAEVKVQSQAQMQKQEEPAKYEECLSCQ